MKSHKFGITTANRRELRAHGMRLDMERLLEIVERSHSTGLARRPATIGTQPKRDVRRHVHVLSVPTANQRVRNGLRNLDNITWFGVAQVDAVETNRWRLNDTHMPHGFLHIRAAALQTNRHPLGLFGSQSGNSEPAQINVRPDRPNGEQLLRHRECRCECRVTPRLTHCHEIRSDQTHVSTPGRSPPTITLA
jgi:hypothetical protein